MRRRQVDGQIRRRRFFRHRIGTYRFDSRHGFFERRDRRVAYDDGERYFRRRTRGRVRCSAATITSTCSGCDIGCCNRLLLLLVVVMVLWRWCFRTSCRSTWRIRQTGTVTTATCSSGGTLLPAVVHLQQQVRAGILFFCRISGRGMVLYRRLSRRVRCGGRDTENGRTFSHTGYSRQHRLREPSTSALRLPLQVDQSLKIRQTTSGRRRGRSSRGIVSRSGSGNGCRGGLSLATVVKRIPPTDRFQEVLPGLPGHGPRQFGARFVFQYAVVFAFQRPPSVGPSRRGQPLLVFDAFLELLGMFFHSRSKRPRRTPAYVCRARAERRLYNDPKPARTDADVTHDTPLPGRRWHCRALGQNASPATQCVCLYVNVCARRAAGMLTPDGT